ncbi:MAG: hypothetical protein RLY57_677 [Candidatus Parcubacteria bacterium]
MTGVSVQCEFMCLTGDKVAQSSLRRSSTSGSVSVLFFISSENISLIFVQKTDIVVILRDRLMVGHQVLVLSIMVRVHVPHPIFKRKNRVEISKFRR